jgi:hypothetical protein
MSELKRHFFQAKKEIEKLTEEVEKLEEKLQKLKSQGNLVTRGLNCPPRLPIFNFFEM